MSDYGHSKDRYPRIDVIFFDFGGGHRASATAFRDVVEQQQRPWQLRMVNLREVFEPIDHLRRITGIRLENVYNRLIGLNLPTGTATILRAVQQVIRASHRSQTELLRNFWLKSRPDLVLSMIPNFNRALFQGLRGADEIYGGKPTPMVTVMTDLADCPPHFWIERQDQYVVCGTPKAATQALTQGYRPERVFSTSGMVVRPEFYQSLNGSREQERARLGLDPNLPTGVVLFGGAGSGQMITIAKRIAQAGLKTQLIFVCGHNQKLRQQLSAMDLPFPKVVEGFTRQIPSLMHLSDYFIGKPGPGSISEAIVAGLPVIVERNYCTMVQERYNTDWVSQNNLGIVLRSFSRVERAVATMLDTPRLHEFHASIARLANRAVFELPDLLEVVIRRDADLRAERPASLPAARTDNLGFGGQLNLAPV